MAKAPPDVGETNWRRIKATVRPLRGKKSAGLPTPLMSSEVETPSDRRCVDGVSTSLDMSGKREKAPLSPIVAPGAEGVPANLIRGRSRPSATPPPPPAQGRGEELPRTPLAKDWERTLRTGRVQPDIVIDLHGHNLAGAHSALSRALDSAAASHARIILVIAGKARGPDEAPRGAIRRELATWLAHSHHAGRILAVRNAHPRHGGAGAVYLVLRKGG